MTKPLLNGSAVMAVDYDYDLGPASQDNKNVVWVPPKDGMPAYLEGWIAIAGTSQLPRGRGVHELPPRPQELRRLRGEHRRGVRGDRRQQVPPGSTINNPAQRYDPAVFARVHWERYLNPEAQQVRNQIWEEVQAA